ncbi:MAG: hypothetical protein K0V04_05220 [Deltaproteobacteria bacterium]|nr:hypothetical protein [Deltaproteobacteria bacterium]
MAKFTGTIQHNALEGGFYELHTDDGATFRLQGADKVNAGDRVVVHGKVAEGGFGIQMSGPAIEVDRIDNA